MDKFLPFFFIGIIFIGCNSHQSKQNTILNQPPYDKLTDSIDKAPKTADLYFRRGTLLYTNEQMALAEKDLRTAWQLNANENYALRLTHLLKEKNADEAIRFLNEALKKIPNSIGLRIMLAKGYESKNELDKSLALCNQIINQYPGELDALILKSEILKDQNKNDEALSVLEKAYLYAPSDVELVHQLAFSYAEAKNPKVLSLSDSLIKADAAQRHAEPYYFKGLYYENSGNYNKAISFFDEAIRHDYNFEDAYMDKGQSYYELKKYSDALKTFQLAATVFAADAEPYYWLGKTQEAMGDTSHAKLNYERAYGLDHSLTEANEAAKRLGSVN